MKTWTWAKLKKVVRACAQGEGSWILWGNPDPIHEALDDADEELRPLLALALSAAHWAPSEWPDLRGQKIGVSSSFCGLCAYWSEVAERQQEYTCDLCPLAEEYGECDDRGSIWREVDEAWLQVRAGHPGYPRADERFDIAAGRMYEALMTLYAREFYKMWPHAQPEASSSRMKG
jgi:hypothetical protein